VRRVGRVDTAGGGWSPGSLRSALRPAISPQPSRAAVPAEPELWCEPLIPAEVDDLVDDLPRSRREEFGGRWGIGLLHRFSPVDILLAASVVVLLAAMVVVAIALTNHV
jgi:hypothetical protein